MLDGMFIKSIKPGLSNATIYNFRDFIFKSSNRRLTIIIYAIAIFLQWGIFKYFYPFASFIHGDSFNYLNSAYYNLDINFYMVGYAKFLRLVSVFTSSDTALVTLQYILMQISGLFLVFTFFKYYQPAKIVRWLLSFFILFNPLFLYMANYVSSDAYFLALSLAWFASLLHLLHNPTRRTVLCNIILLFIAFTIRYNALIYPIITILGLSISLLSLRQKLYYIILTILPVITFVLFTGSKYQELTGTWQYAPFSGWQLVNNAMYAYRYVDSSKRVQVPKKYKELDKMIRNYFDTSRDLKKHPVESLQASTVYMWDSRISPLYKYSELVFKKDSVASVLKKWASMGPLYKEYGFYIIKHYPKYFLKYFIWPNSKKYYSPPVEFLASYNSNRDSTTSLGKTWFNYRSTKLTTRTKDNKVSLLDYYPILAGITNIVLFFLLIFFMMLKAKNASVEFQKSVFLAASVWFINAGFTIFASSAALRFQAFPIILSFVLTLQLIDWLAKVSFSTGNNLDMDESIDYNANNQYENLLKIKSNKNSKTDAILDS